MHTNENNEMGNMNIRDFRDLDFQLTKLLTTNSVAGDEKRMLMNLFPSMQRQMFENYNPDVSDEVVETPFKISNEELKINSIDELPPLEEDFSYFTSTQVMGEPTQPTHYEDVVGVIENVIETAEPHNEENNIEHDLDDCVSMLSITEKPNNDNYNKMNLQSLKLLVVSRGLTNDANKLKKNEIIKMLKTADSINV
jgi:hypothetical protein